MLTGIIASTSGILPAFTDEFTGTNGASLASKWNNINGAWQIQLNKATTYSSPTLNPLATFTANTKNVNIRANAGELNQGWGTAFWVTSSNTWWAAVTERTQFFGCDAGHTNNGDGTCTIPAYSYNYDCSYTTTTPAVEQACGPNISTDAGNGANCEVYDYGGLNCNNRSDGTATVCYLCGINGCCAYGYYQATGTYFGYPNSCYNPFISLTKIGNGCYGDYFACQVVLVTYYVDHPYQEAVTTTTAATCTANVAASSYTATTYYTHKLKLIKSVSGTVTEMGSVDVGTNATTPGGIGFVQVVTNEAGQITATAQLSTGGAVAQIQQTPTASRATKHGIILKTTATGSQASTIESFVYSPV